MPHPSDSPVLTRSPVPPSCCQEVDPSDASLLQRYLMGGRGGRRGGGGSKGGLSDAFSEFFRIV